jgi:SAM-dependent methyltransferase
VRIGVHDSIKGMSKAKFPKPGETYKAHERRLRTGWFDRFAPQDKGGIDIGPADDPLNQTFRRWELHPDGDATFMRGVPDGVFNTVYCSHILEHLDEPLVGLQNWYRILKPGGHLVVIVPHRDLYEKRVELPSRWNPDHKWFWLPETAEPPCTLSFRDTIREAIPDGELVSFTVLDEGFNDPGRDAHSWGEYSIEAIVRKPGA